MSSPLNRSTALDPTVKFQLQQHLLNVHQGNASPLKLGSTEQLAVAAKISSSNQISECFSLSNARSYPVLIKRNYLVACVERKKDVKVFAVYTLEQMNQMQAQCNTGFANQIDWRVLEISQELESDLLTSIFIKDKCIFNTLNAICEQDSIEQYSSYRYVNESKFVQDLLIQDVSCRISTDF